MLTQTTAYNTDAWYCNTKLPHPRCSLSLQYAPRSTARTLQFLIIPRHQPFISIASKTYTNYSIKLLAQRRISTTSQAVCPKPTTHTPKILLSFYPPSDFLFQNLLKQLPSPAGSLFPITPLPSKPSHAPLLTTPEMINPAAFIKKVDGGLNS